MVADWRSKKMKSGTEKAPHRALLYALGLTREEIDRPLVGVVNAANEIIPGHLHLNSLAEAVKSGIRMAGGTSGAAIGRISPEAAAGGVIALVQDGDEIEIDIPNRKLNLLVDAVAFEMRRNCLKITVKKANTRC